MQLHIKIYPMKILNINFVILHDVTYRIFVNLIIVGPARLKLLVDVSEITADSTRSLLQLSVTLHRADELLKSIV